VKRLHKFLALPSAGRTLVLLSLVLLPVITVFLRTRGMARTMALFKRSRPHDDRRPGALDPQEIARLVNAAASFLRVSCLSQSLLLWHLLHHRDASCEIRLGVAKTNNGGLAAHAWFEFGGLPLIDSPDALKNYAALPSRHNY
jgi:hypothetical protein